jgi:hypothetical protein
MNGMENHDEVYAGVMDQCQGVLKKAQARESVQNARQ